MKTLPMFPVCHGTLCTECTAWLLFKKNIMKSFISSKQLAHRLKIHPLCDQPFLLEGVVQLLQFCAWLQDAEHKLACSADAASRKGYPAPALEVCDTSARSLPPALPLTFSPTANHVHWSSHVLHTNTQCALKFLSSRAIGFFFLPWGFSAYVV